MSLKGKIEAIVYAAEEPVTLEQIAVLLKSDVLAELDAAAPAEVPEPPTSEELEPAGPSMPAVEEGGTTAAPGPELPPEAEANGATPEPGDSAATEAEPAASVPPEATPGTATASDEPSEARAHEEPAPTSADDTVPTSAEDAGSTAAIADELQQQAPERQDVAAQPSDTAPEPRESASVDAPSGKAPKRQKADPDLPRVKDRVRGILNEMVAEYASEDRGLEIRIVAGGYRMATKPEHHDLVRAFAKSLKPPMKLSLQALETLAVVAYKQPITAPEVAEIRGVDSSGVLATLLDRKLVTTAGRKAVIGRPILYKTTRDFLLRFGLKDVNELPSMEEFEKLAQDQTDLFDKTAQPAPAPAAEAAAQEQSPEPVEPPAEPEPGDNAGDFSSGADTAESIVRQQVEGAERAPETPGTQEPTQDADGADADKNDDAPVTDPSPA